MKPHVLTITPTATGPWESWDHTVECPGDGDCWTWVPCHACILDGDNIHEIDDGEFVGGVEHMSVDFKEMSVQREGQCFVLSTIDDDVVDDAFFNLGKDTRAGRWEIQWDADRADLTIHLRKELECSPGEQ